VATTFKAICKKGLYLPGCCAVSLGQ